MKKPEEKLPMPKAVPAHVKKEIANRVKKAVIPVKQPVPQPVKKTP